MKIFASSVHYCFMLSKYVYLVCIGCGVNDSPVGLAAYILEKFSSWADLKNRDLADGGLERYTEIQFYLKQL